MVQQSEHYAAPEEMKKLVPLQAALALIMYIQAENLRWDYRVALSRVKEEDKTAKQLRDSAIQVWLAKETDIFRKYYMSSEDNKRDVLSTDPKDEQACRNLLEKYMQFKDQLTRAS